MYRVTTGESAMRRRRSSSRSGPMKFDELDEKMRIFETAADQSVLPGVFMVARLDGRGSHRADEGTAELRCAVRMSVSRDLMPRDRRARHDLRFRAVYRLHAER
jgi:hypothetical protein